MEKAEFNSHSMCSGAPRLLRLEDHMAIAGSPIWNLLNRWWGEPGSPGVPWGSTLPELICRVSFPTDSPLIRNLNLGHIDLGLRPKPRLPTETSTHRQACSFLLHRLTTSGRRVSLAAGVKALSLALRMTRGRPGWRERMDGWKEKGEIVW